MNKTIFTYKVCEASDIPLSGILSRQANNCSPLHSKHPQTLLTCLAKGKAETLARVYIDSDPTHSEADKRRISIQTVDRDQEPRQFRAAFPSWQEGMWGVNFNSFG